MDVRKGITSDGVAFGGKEMSQIVEQINVYDLLGNNIDPIYEKLSRLQKGESTELDDMRVSLNEFGLYELSGDSLHECFQDLKKCYRFVCSLLKMKMRDGESGLDV